MKSLTWWARLLSARVTIAWALRRRSPCTSLRRFRTVPILLALAKVTKRQRLISSPQPLTKRLAWLSFATRTTRPVTITPKRKFAASLRKCRRTFSCSWTKLMRNLQRLPIIRRWLRCFRNTRTCSSTVLSVRFTAWQGSVWVMRWLVLKLSVPCGKSSRRLT